MTDTARVDLAATYDHAECMCLKDERCRYHQALDRAETLAAEVARQRLVVDAAVAWERCGNWSIADDQAMDLAAAVHKYRANPQEAAPAPAERVGDGGY